MIKSRLQIQITLNLKVKAVLAGMVQDLNIIKFSLNVFIKLYVFVKIG